MGMIGNETELLLNCVDPDRKSVNKSETWHMLRSDIAASSLNILWQNFDSVKRYDETNITIFALSLWEKYRWGLTSVGQFISFHII